ncbi:hypothetical protein Tco_1101042, partial [Tanacetum coccineum]
IHIDNESTICIVKNPVYHSKTKHIEIRHHSVEKIHTDLNVADLLTKPFDGPRFNYLVVSIDCYEKKLRWCHRPMTPLHVQRVDMVINPPWNLPFLGAKGLTSPEQTATGKGISNPLMAVMVCQKPYGIQLTKVSSTES